MDYGYLKYFGETNLEHFVYWSDVKRDMLSLIISIKAKLMEPPQNVFFLNFSTNGMYCNLHEKSYNILLGYYFKKKSILFQINLKTAFNLQKGVSFQLLSDLW